MPIRVNLDKKTNNKISRLLAKGHYKSRDELLRVGVRMLIERDRQHGDIGTRKRRSRSAKKKR